MAPPSAWARATAEPGPATFAAVIGGGLGLLALTAWAAARDYRRGRPGVTLPYAVLLGLAAGEALLSSTGSQGRILLMGYVGMGIWLLALKHLRLGARAAEWWTVAGLIGFGWLVMGLQSVLMPHYNKVDARADELEWMRQLVVGSVARLLGWVPLIHRCYAALLPANLHHVLRLSLRVTAWAMLVGLVVMLPYLLQPKHHATPRRT